MSKIGENYMSDKELYLRVDEHFLAAFRDPDMLRAIQQVYKIKPLDLPKKMGFSNKIYEKGAFLTDILKTYPDYAPQYVHTVPEVQLPFMPDHAMYKVFLPEISTRVNHHFLREAAEQGHVLSQHYLLIKQQNHRCWDFPANTIELGYKFPESFGEIDSLGSRSVEDYNQGVAPVNAVDSNFWLEFPQVLDILGQVKSFIFLQ